MVLQTSQVAMSKQVSKKDTGHRRRRHKKTADSEARSPSAATMSRIVASDVSNMSASGVETAASRLPPAAPAAEQPASHGKITAVQLSPTASSTSVQPGSQSSGSVGNTFREGAVPVVPTLSVSDATTAATPPKQDGSGRRCTQQKGGTAEVEPISMSPSSGMTLGPSVAAATSTSIGTAGLSEPASAKDRDGGPGRTLPTDASTGRTDRLDPRRGTTRQTVSKGGSMGRAIRLQKPVAGVGGSLQQLPVSSSKVEGKVQLPASAPDLRPARTSLPFTKPANYVSAPA
ncbi:uncharacterized protein [Dermacentor andersoni]|uniref:uncharacterized protein n=1 Tax=Dermacentor andersoni TaxID=34620 RepID=UPI0024171E7C|nr:uncharacterized protein LOC126534799 [Dermacentor andersoni]